MKCPFCSNSESEVLESRVSDDGESIRRRRKCGKCEKRFTTYEKVTQNFFWVIKKDGTREPFEKEKIKRGLLRAIEKRNVSLELIDELVDRVERELLKRNSQEVSTKLVGSLVMKFLKKIDKVAWLRFASVYFEFEDLTDFEKLIEKNEKN